MFNGKVSTSNIKLDTSLLAYRLNVKTSLHIPILLRAQSSFVKFTRFIEKIQKNDSITYQTNLYFSHEHWWFLY